MDPVNVDVDSDSFAHASNQSFEHSKHAFTAFLAAFSNSLLLILLVLLLPIDCDKTPANSKTLEHNCRTSRPLGLHTLSTSCVLVRPSFTFSSIASANAFKISIPHVCFLLLLIMTNLLLMASPSLFCKAELASSPANE